MKMKVCSSRIDYSKSFNLKCLKVVANLCSIILKLLTFNYSSHYSFNLVLQLKISYF